MYSRSRITVLNIPSVLIEGGTSTWEEKLLDLCRIKLTQASGSCHCTFEEPSAEINWFIHVSIFSTPYIRDEKLHGILL